MEEYQKYEKITLCTVCMGRLHHVKKTLLKNIKDNLEYPEIRFVLLDYNSKDKLEYWVRDQMGSYIQTGLLTYYKTTDPVFFHRSHARNMAFRLAGNGIICNIDADNFTGGNFAFFINDRLQKYPESFLSVDYYSGKQKYKDTFGRIVCLKNDFLTIEGYDETMSGYGYEDIDFCQRLIGIGKQECFIKEEKYLQSIAHTDEERQTNEQETEKIKSIYIRYINPFQSKIIYLFIDKTFAKATLLDRREGFGNPTLKEKKWILGNWNTRGNKILFETNNSRWNLAINKDGNLSDREDDVFYQIKDKNFLKKLILNYPLLKNHQKLLNNINQKQISVNNGNFGQGTVIKNFKEKIVMK